MELLQMQYFLKIAETGNMTRAAEELYISQSSLSRTIARLERDLGVALFDRVGRQICLNDFGRAFLFRVQQIFLQLDEAKREIADLQGDGNHKIKVGVTIPGILTFFLERYVSLQNQIQFSQFMIHRNEAVSCLTEGKSDFVITADHIASDTICWVPLVHDSIIAMIPEQHPLARNETVTLSMLVGEPIVTTQPGFDIRPLIEDCFSTVGAAPNIVFEESDPNLTLQIVQSGIGIGFISQHNLVNYLRRTGRLDAPQIPGIGLCVITDACANMDVGIAYLKSRYQSQADLAFMDALRGSCKDMSAVMFPESFNPYTLGHDN